MKYIKSTSNLSYLDIFLAWSWDKQTLCRLVTLVQWVKVRVMISRISYFMPTGIRIHHIRLLPDPS